MISSVKKTINFLLKNLKNTWYLFLKPVRPVSCEPGCEMICSRNNIKRQKNFEQKIATDYNPDYFWFLEFNNHPKLAQLFLLIL